MVLEKSPLVSFIIISYNQEKYIRSAIKGAVSQTYSPLEIIVSDDASVDNTFDVIKDEAEQYSGPHGFIINCNEQNMGLSGNINKAISISHGSIIVLAGGDDIAHKDRVKQSVIALNKDSQLKAVSFELFRFSGNCELPVEHNLNNNENDISLYSLDILRKSPTFHLYGASRAMTRDVYDVFGKINSDCPTEDSVFLFRALLLGKVAYAPRQIVYYRVHDTNLYASDNKYRIDYYAVNRQYIKDIEKARAMRIVTEEQYTWIKRSLKTRLNFYVKRSMFFNKKCLRNYFRYILFSVCFSKSQKVRFFKGIFR